MYPGPAPLSTLITIPVLAVLALVAFVVVQRRAGRSAWKSTVAAALWLAAFGALAASGVLAKETLRPSPFLLVLPLPFVVAVAWALSPAGRDAARAVPLGVLVGAQGFRFFLELAMHEAAEAHVMPMQMSFSGRNFDIVTGATAIILAFLARGSSPSPWLVLAWNVLGTLLLLNVVGVAIAASPAIAAFGPDAVNRWVEYVPFVWLPSVLVPTAIAGHVLVFRRVLHELRG